MASLSNKIKLYTNQEVDFLKDVKLQDDGQGAYIKEWNLAAPKPTLEQLNALKHKQQLMRTIKELSQHENSFIWSMGQAA
jgi:hypothetical protein